MEVFRMVVIVTMFGLFLLSCGEKSSSEPAAENGVETDSPSSPVDPSPDEVSAAGHLKVSATLPSSVDLDTVAAIPVFGGGLGDLSMAKDSISPIESGNLAVELSREPIVFPQENTSLLDGDNEDSEELIADSHVVVLWKKSSDGDRFLEGESMRFLQVKVPQSGQAINLFSRDYSKDRLDVGALQDSGDKLSSELQLQGEDFDGLTDNQLAELAKADDALRGYKNIHMNTNIENGTSFDAIPYFHWNAPLAGLLDGFSQPTGLSYFGYGVYFRTNQPGLTLESVCLPADPGYKTLEILPPTPVTVDGESAAVASFTNTPNSNSTPVINEGFGTRRECADSGMYAYSDRGQVGFNIGGVQGAISPGYWQIKHGDDIKAKFDLAAVYPFDAEGNPLIYMPSLKIIKKMGVDAIAAVEIELYQFDKGALGKIEEFTAVKKIVEEVGLSFTQHSDQGQVEEYKTFPLKISEGKITISADDYDKVWNEMNDAEGQPEIGERVDVVAFQYELYGNSFRFEFRRNTSN